MGDESGQGLDGQGQDCRGRVLVVGAGVSGCACAATLAVAGVQVTVVGAALDRTGLPRLGPLLASGRDAVRRAEEILVTVPDGLRKAWLRSSSWPEDRSFLAVDRRRVSIETKHALEQMPGLDFRQGVVCGLRPLEAGQEGEGRPARGSVEAETVFGEALSAEAIVVAAGCGLGREEGSAGGETSDGGLRPLRSQGLREALESLGARFAPTTWQVDARVRAGAATESRHTEWEMVRRGLSTSEGPSVETMLVEVTRDRGGTRERAGTRDGAEMPTGGQGQDRTDCWAESPYEEEGLWAREALVVVGQDGQVIPLACADGVATGEISVSAEPEEGPSAADEREPSAMSDLTISRLRREESGLMVAGVEPGGRLVGPGLVGGSVWVTGRAGGAKDYLESLASGVRTGLLLAESLR